MCMLLQRSAGSPIRASRGRHVFLSNARLEHTVSAHSVSGQMPKIRYIGPTIWTLAAASTFYLGFAAYDVYRDAQNVKKRRRLSSSPVTWEDLHAGKSTALLREMFSRQARDPLSLDELRSPAAVVKYWNQLLDPEKLIWGVMGLNTGLFALGSLSSRVAASLYHVPAWSRNYTFLTSTFGHVGIFHLALNMYGLYNFGPPVAMSKSFEGNGSHLAAFYLSSGVMTSLAYHMSAGWPSPRLRMTPGLGASGAVLALVGAFAMEYPENRIGIIFLPFTFIPAQDALAALALFETYGLFIGIKSLPFAHAAHLAGIAIGSAYVYFDGKTKLWKRVRKIAFKQMRALGML